MDEYQLNLKKITRVTMTYHVTC